MRGQKTLMLAWWVESTRPFADGDKVLVSSGYGRSVAASCVVGVLCVDVHPYNPHWRFMEKRVIGNVIFCGPQSAEVSLGLSLP